MKYLVSAFLLSLILFPQNAKSQFKNDIVERKLIKERPKLKQAPIREADLFWEKKVWQIIDTRHKMNQTFRYPAAPLFETFRKAAENGHIDLFVDDSFEDRIDNPNGIFSEIDTVRIFNPITYVEEITVVNNTINYEDINEYRIKEIWYFDEANSTMRVQILGIAPIIAINDDNGNFRYNKPLCWINYPQAREVLSRATVFNPGNDNQLMTWDDLFQMRYFDSVITKKSNILDARLEDLYSGEERLLEAKKAEEEIFNFEQDLWSY